MAYGSLPSRWNRSVSNPARRPPSTEITDFDLSALDRRNSLDSVITPGPSSNPTKRHYGLPSIRALREKFQRFASGGGKESHQGIGRNNGSVKSVESPKKLVKRAGSGRIADDGKRIKASETNTEGGGGMVKSASMPAISSLRSRDNDESRPPPLPLGNVQPTVDALLAGSIPKSQSFTLSPASPSSTTRRLPRASSISIGARRPQTSENLSPTSQPLPVFNRISSDFARPSAAPPLSALRAQQIRETETLNSSIAATNRHSRILPGATLPSLFPIVDSERPTSSLSRSQSARTSTPSEKAQQRTSLRSQDSTRRPSMDSTTRNRSSLLSNGLPKDTDRLRDDLAYRRHSLSPVIPSAANSSPDGSPSRPEEKSSETQRGKTLSSVLGAAARRTSTGLGLGLPSLASEVGGGGGIEKRRPSKPFPAGFDQVTFPPTSTTEVASPAIGPRKTLKAISIAPRKPNDSPALTKTPSPTNDAPSLPSHLPVPESTSPLNPFPQLSPVRRRSSTARLENQNSPAPEVSTEADPPLLRKSQSVDELRGEERLTKTGIPQEGGVEIAKPGSYAARLAELRLLRTPVLGGGDKAEGQFETVSPAADPNSSEVERVAASLRKPNDDDEEDESRPVSPTHSTNSPGADHPFRLSTYLDFLTLTRSSPSIAKSTAPLSLSSSSAQNALPTGTGAATTRVDQDLTLAQMEQEIVKMEKELALAGTPRSFFTEEGDYDSVSLSPELPRTTAHAEPAADSPSANNDVVTPRTARKWSIVEVERAYERMKRLLGSSSSSRMYTPSDVGGDSQVDRAVEESGEQAKTGMVSSLDIADEQVDDVFSPVRSQAQSSSLSETPSSSLFVRRVSSSPTSDLKLKPLPILPPPSPASSRSQAGTPSEPLRETDKENVDQTIVPQGQSNDTPNRRRLVLPSRVRSKTSIDEFTPRKEDGSESPVKRAQSVEPISPSRASGRRSRLEDTGLLRSGAGREIQRRALGDLSSDATPPTSPTRLGPRLNVQRLGPSADSPRRRESTRVSESSTWYPATPHRIAARSRSATADSLTTDQDRSQLLSDNESESTSTSTARPELLEIRNLDKLQIFFKYTAVKAELSKAEIERDALADALRETRETLAEVRKQRDVYEADLKQERLFSHEVKQHLGGEREIYLDRLENLVASRAAWQSRAEEALEELRKSKDEIVKLEQERAMLSRGVSTVNSPSTVVPATSTSPPGSPTLTMNPDDRPNQNLLPPPSSPLPPNFRQKRTISTHSTASSALGFDGFGGFEAGSPLLSQTLHFGGSKSSDGTFSATPTKPFHPSRIPLRTTRIGSNTTAFASEEEEVDRSFDSNTSYDVNEDDEKGLKERDRELLENFTNEIPKETLEHQHRNLSHLLA